jgi:hypothetical protein
VAGGDGGKKTRRQLLGGGGGVPGEKMRQRSVGIVHNKTIPN